MVSDLLLAGGTLIAPGLPPMVADVLIEYDDPLTRSGPTIVEVGDLADREAHETVAATDSSWSPARGIAPRTGARGSVRAYPPTWCWRGTPPERWR